MPSSSLATSSEPGCVLIAAPSGRALAQAARNAGYVPLVADFFDDLDTRQWAAANRLVESDLSQGYETESLLSALTALSQDRDVTGLIYGAGFEDRLGLLETLSTLWPIVGNEPAAVASVKDPRALAALCAGLRIPHPDICFTEPFDRAAWLIKHAGGSGGIHIASANSYALADGDYYQMHVAGIPVSALILANGSKACVLGFSEQWVSPAPGQPYRFGGSARPARLDDNLTERLRRDSEAIAQAARLKGLNSLDFLVDGADYHLIEINPRPGATLDIFHDLGGRLLRAHVEACKGQLPMEPLRFEAAEAAAFVYSPYHIPSMPSLDWPDWTADRQKPKSKVAEHDPLCTVMACATGLPSARRLLDERTAMILTLIENQLHKEAAA